MNRQPVHVLYGGAHLFREDIVDRVRRVAMAALDRYDTPHKDLVRAKLEREPIEDFRIDFEDGYVEHSLEERESDARRAAELVAAGIPIPRIGIRVPRGDERMLETFFATAGQLPKGFRVTLPKVEDPDEVAWLREYAPAGIHVEVLVETRPILRRLFEFAHCDLHLGPYDLQASLGIPSAFQSLHHPVCHSVRMLMLQTGLLVADGPTKKLPIGEAEQDGWRQHREDILRSLSEGFHQSWDIHPAQLVSRYATLIGFYSDHLPAAEKRLENFHEAGRRATRLGQQFDDASTIRGLEAFVARGRHLLSH